MTADEPYTLPEEVIQGAMEAMFAMIRTLEFSTTGRYKVDIETVVVRFNDGRDIRVGDVMEFLGPLERQLSTGGKGPVGRGRFSLRNKMGILIVEFTKTFLLELREAICGKNKKKFPIGNKASVAIWSIGHMVADHFGIKEEFARVLAASILLAILSATKGAFCRMTDAEALKALMEAIG